VTHLRKMMLEELQRRHYSEATTQRYIPPHSYQIETAYSINNRGQYSAPQSVSEACTLCCYPRPTRKPSNYVDIVANHSASSAGCAVGLSNRFSSCRKVPLVIH
jgi:hypothetical protein